MRFSPVAFAAALALGIVASAAAQDAVTVSGHVSSANHPLQNASVRIEQLNLGATTDAEGRYSFIIPSSRVRGQTVSLVAKHVRFVTASVSVTLVGGALVKDFELAAVGGPVASSPTPSNGALPPAPTPSAAGLAASPVLVLGLADRSAGLVVDSTAFEEAAGPMDLATALAGRIPGASVRSDAAVGGSTSIVLRGPTSMTGSNQPLIVVDGMPIDNTPVTTAAQRFGFGGFDYGTGMQDLDLGDVESASVLDGTTAAALYGGRGANGAILVTTKSGRGLNGFDVSARQQVTFDSPLRVPTYQNLFGQGSGGQFAFFDGRGGGTNDAFAESWGPALNGQPISQASLTAAGQPDVRSWLPLPNNVSGYFASGRSLTTDVAAQGSNDAGSFRASLNNRDYSGLTPGSGVTRRGGSITGSLQAAPTLALHANANIVSDNANDLPGTGFDQSNPVAEFSRIGRQVDVAALRSHLVDATGQQISWNYAGFNNPYFQPLANTNSDQLTRWFGGVGLDYAARSWLTVSARAGTDQSNATQDFAVASGWMGGFPDAAGRGDFSAGGSQHQTLTLGQSDGDLLLRATPRGSSSPLWFTVGANWRNQSVTSNAAIVDNSGAGATPATATTSSNVSATTDVEAVSGAAHFALGDYTAFTLGARNEWSSAFASGQQANLYPSASVGFDLARALTSGAVTPTASGAATTATLRAGWSQSGTDFTRYSLATLYSGYQPTDSVSLAPAPTVVASPTLGPETTSSLELGGDFGFFDQRLGVHVTYYYATTDNLIVAQPTSSATAVATNGGSLTNSGVEAAIDFDLLRSTNGLNWRLSATGARNENTVQSLLAGASAIPLTPTRWGVDLEARSGQPLGVIVGDGFLRNQSGALVLRGGLPLPDTAAGPHVLGDAQAAWTGGLSNRFTLGRVEASVLFDGSVGGKIFSATNMWGATSGVLAETAVRPDSGLLIAGVDAVTGQPNVQHVSTEAYYHALRAIPERWVYDASFVKLRELRVSTTILTPFLPGFRTQGLRASIVGRNLWMWAKAPNIDPETALSSFGFPGLELGQLPTVRSLGFQLTMTP